MRSVKAESAEQQAKWVSVKKRLPELNKIVLVSNDGVIELSQRGDDGHGWLWCEPDDDGTISERFYDDTGESVVTHWMSIPKPPKVRRREP